MDGFLGTLKELVLLFVILSVGSTLIDYGRVNSGNIPLFCTSKYNEKSKVQKFRGIFYQASRKVTVSVDEDLSDSTNIKFYILTKKMNVPSEFKSHNNDYVLNTKVSSECGEVTLYYSSKDTNIYTYCLDSIKMSENGSSKSKELSEYFKSDEKYIDELINYIPYRGFAPDRASLFYRTEDKNMVDNGLTMYQCHKKDNHDIYIGPVDMEFQSSFCNTDVIDDEVVTIEEDDTTKVEEDTKDNSKEEKKDDESDNNKSNDSKSDDNKE